MVAAIAIASGMAVGCWAVCCCSMDIVIDGTVPTVEAIAAVDCMNRRCGCFTAGTLWS